MRSQGGQRLQIAHPRELVDALRIAAVPRAVLVAACCGLDGRLLRLWRSPNRSRNPRPGREHNRAMHGCDGGYVRIFRWCTPSEGGAGTGLRCGAPKQQAVSPAGMSCCDRAALGASGRHAAEPMPAASHMVRTCAMHARPQPPLSMLACKLTELDTWQSHHTCRAAAHNRHLHRCCIGAGALVQQRGGWTPRPVIRGMVALQQHLHV